MRTITLVSALALFANCGGDEEPSISGVDFKQEMRDFVQGISHYAKTKNGNFVIIPQNGQEIITTNGEPDGTPDVNYLSAIDATGREDLFYGYDEDNVATPASESDYLIDFLDIAKDNGVAVLTTDYCWDHSKMDDSYAQNKAKGYISFAAPDRELNTIPAYPATITNENTNDITDISQAKNFLYLINPDQFANVDAFISAVQATNYDALIIDAFFNEKILSQVEVTQLKTKANGGKRLVIAYMSIGEAEDYRYYWESGWGTGNPSFIKAVNPDWAGNYKVAYWEPEWQAIIYGSSDAYLDKLLASGFDGAYLDIIDAYEYFEEI
ncbi:MAG: endo alpha-1,4 polygalactosaminidase [Cyclobacteriaceae bacterium]|nr:endo alpha-1,4 polygalactosaminidase [Cyclobacteriaceae bacterium]